MSVAVSVATSAAAAGGAASSAAAAARRQEAVKQCKEWMPSFNDINSTKEQKQYYSQCVRMIYPQNQEMPYGVEIALKASVFALLVALVVGLIQGFKEGLSEVFILTMVWVISTALALIVIWGACFGLIFLFS